MPHHPSPSERSFGLSVGSVLVVLGAIALWRHRQTLGESMVAVGSVLVVLGLVAGSAVSAWSARFLRTLLFKMSPYDGPAWLVATLVLVSVAVLASLIPAWRAGRVDPVAALRAEG